MHESNLTRDWTRSIQRVSCNLEVTLSLRLNIYNQQPFNPERKATTIQVDHVKGPGVGVTQGMTDSRSSLQTRESYSSKALEVTAFA